MPVIVPILAPVPIITIAGGSDLTAAGSVSQQFMATIAGGSSLSAIAGLLIEISDPIDIGGGSSLYALGRIGDEANIFGVVELTGGSGIDPTGRLQIRPGLVLAGGSSLFANGRIAAAESGEFKILLTIADDPAVGYNATYSARILADSVSYPIRSFDFNEGGPDAGMQAEFTLQRPSDRAAILAADLFTFDVYDNGTWKTLFEAGRRSQASYAFAFNQARPNDSLTVSTVGAVADRLRLSPPQNLTVFDPYRETIDAAEYTAIYDEFGQAYEHDLLPIGDLTLYQLLQFVLVTKCGFDSFETTIPNFPIRRADFSYTGSYYDGIKSFLGPFNPFLLVKDNKITFFDSTIAIPAGMSSAIVGLESEQYKDGNFSVTEQTADSYLVQYTENQAAYDYSNDFEISNLGDPEITGTDGGPDYTETVTTKTFRNFYRTSNPLIPIDTQKVIEVNVTKGYLNGGLETLSTTTERISIDPKLRLTKIVKEKTATIPDLDGSGFPSTTATVRSEVTTFSYSPDVRNPRREYMSKQVREVSGLLAIDSENTHLDADYKQEFYDAWRGGNLSADITTEFGPIETYIEKSELKRNGQIEVRQKTINFLTTPPNVDGDTTQGRAGDPTTNAISTKSSETIVYRTGLSSSSSPLIPFPIGEIPLTIGKALAKRILDKRQRLAGSVQMKGLNLAFGPGTIFELFDRDDESAGFFLTTARRISGSDLGLRSQKTTQSIGVIEVATDGPALSPSLSPPGGLSAAAGSTKTFTLQIEGRTDYELSAVSDNADVRAWAKANPGDAFVNLHTTPIDLSPYNATARTFYFELRIDAGAIDGETSITIRIAKP